MGGASCAIPHLAIMHPFVSGTKSVVPADPKDHPAFDEKLRRSAAQSDLNKGLVDAEQVDAVCTIMGKPVWADNDRHDVNEILNSLYS